MNIRRLEHGEWIYALCLLRQLCLVCRTPYSVSVLLYGGGIPSIVYLLGSIVRST